MRDPMSNLDRGEKRVEVELQWDESFFMSNDIFMGEHDSNYERIKY